MQTMTWEAIEKDWGGLQKRHRMELAQAVARYCIGHSIKDVAKRLGQSRDWVQSRLDLAGVIAGVGSPTPLVGGDRGAIEDSQRIVRDFGPSVEVALSGDGKGNQYVAAIDGDDAEAFEPYIDHYVNEGHTPAAATRLAKAEWAAEAAVEAGVIKEDTKKSGERVNKILFPEDDVDTWTLRFRGHMAAVERAAEFLDSPETKINYLRRKSTCEKVASAHAKWLEQVERVCNFHPSTFNEEV